MLVKKTLATLARGNFQGSLYVVVPSDQLAAYQRAVMGNPVHCIVLHCEKGLTRQRRFFREQMAVDTEIVFIDDDVEAVKLLTPTGLVHCRHVDALAHYVFQTMAFAGEDCYLAGVYPMANRDWMSRSIVRGNAYVVGALYFMRNREEVVDPEEQELEDWSRQLGEQAADRPVLRFNFIGIQTQYFKNKGGLQDTRTGVLRAQVVDHLVATYPTLVKRKVRRDGTPDVAFVTRQQLRWEEAPLPCETVAPSESAAPATASEPLLEQSAPDAHACPEQ
jgi:hypothetical protein